MAHETFSRRDVAIRLDGPAADHFPASFFDALTHLFEHLRVGALNPTVMSGRGMAVTKVRRFLHAVERAAKSGEHQIRAVAPGPQPRGVDVRIADDVQRPVFGIPRRASRRSLWSLLAEDVKPGGQCAQDGRAAQE